MQRKFVLLAVMLAVVIADPALAQTAPDTNVHVGSTFYDLMIAYAGIIGTVVSALAGWALYRFTGIRLEQNARNAIETFANNAAGAFLMRYDSLKNVNVDVHNPDIAALANGALTRVPDALNRFGLGVEDVKQRIVEKIGILAPPLAPVPVVPVTPVP